MSYSAYTDLVGILDPHLERYEDCSNGSSPILVEHIRGLGLRVLAGGVVSDNRHLFGMSKSAAYVCLDDFLTAVNSSPELAIALPSTPAEWNACNAGFQAKASKVESMLRQGRYWSRQ